jgi:hypothetical protein
MFLLDLKTKSTARQQVIPKIVRAGCRISFAKWQSSYIVTAATIYEPPARKKQHPVWVFPIHNKSAVVSVLPAQFGKMPLAGYKPSIDLEREITTAIAALKATASDNDLLPQKRGD